MQHINFQQSLSWNDMVLPRLLSCLQLLSWDGMTTQSQSVKIWQTVQCTIVIWSFPCVAMSLPPFHLSKFCHDVLMSARYSHHLLIHVPFMCCQLHLQQKLLQQQWALREVSDISQKASMQPTYHLNVNRLCVLQCGLLQNKRKWGWCIFAYHFCINFFILFTQWIDQKLFWSWWLWLQGTTYINKQ